MIANREEKTMIANLEYYRLFIAAATLGSATRAAEALHLTQSGVSQGIRKLEDELGTSLFERSKSGLTLTPEGKILFQHIEKAFTHLTVGERKVRNTVSKKQVVYSLGATETALKYFIAEPLKQLHAENPDMELHLVGSTIPSLCEDLRAERVEAAFLFSPFECPEMYTMFPVAEIQDIPVASSDSSFSARTLLELSEQSLITVSEEFGARRLIDHYFMDAGIIFRPQITVKSMGSILPLVKAGLGIGIVPDVMAEEGLQDGSLRRLPIDTIPARRTLYFAQLKNKPLLALNRRMLELVNESLGNPMPDLP